MQCAWDELLEILPKWLRQQIQKSDKDTLQEIRLRLGSSPILVRQRIKSGLDGCVTAEDLRFCVNCASRYSPWAAQSAADGYITAGGGHRIGICGEAVVQNGHMTGIRTVRSLCIRVARDIQDVAKPYRDLTDSVLIIGPPGSGKTTFLRDLIRQRSDREQISVVDERLEIFPAEFGYCGPVDILSGCPKAQGIHRLLRTMGPETIAVDEITAKEDCSALLQAGRCGVRVLATVHADTMEDLKERPLYRDILDTGIFAHFLIMSRDKSVREERLKP